MTNEQLELFTEEPGDFTFGEYQILVQKTALYPFVGDNYVYPLLGLAGEVGEIHEKFKKLIRDGKGYDVDGYLTEDFRKDITKELGDVLWYIAALAFEMGVGLDVVASTNFKKLIDRKERNVIQGSGDNR